MVRSRRTQEVVAEVKMDNEGLIFVDRIAVAVDPKTGEKLSKTMEGQEGIIFTNRTADTYNNDGRRTHRTRTVERGIIFPERVAETTAEGKRTGKTVTRIRDKGVIFRNVVANTDKDK